RRRAWSFVLEPGPLAGSHSNPNMGETLCSAPALARQTLSFGVGELAQLPLAHALGHMARGALEALLRAFAALGGERRARGHLLLLRSRRHDTPPGNQPWNVQTRHPHGNNARVWKVPTRGSGWARAIAPAPRSAARNSVPPAPGTRRAGAGQTWHWRAKCRRP